MRSGTTATTPSPLEGEVEKAALSLCGEMLLPDTSGALWWEAERTLIVADLHLEKGSAHAARGVLLPPYDTAATLRRLAAVLERRAPRRVIALGDSFHDVGAGARIAPQDCSRLAALQRSVEWVWIAGNHDPVPPDGIGGDWIGELALGPISFRHEPRLGAEGEIAGHLHPVAKLRHRGRGLRRRCFAADGRRIVLPAFGSFTGGLNVLDRAWHGLFEGRSFAAWMLGERSVYAVPARRLVA